MADEQPTPSITLPEISDVVASQWFKSQPSDARLAGLNNMLMAAHSAAGADADWTPDRQRMFGEFAAQAQREAAPDFWERSGNFLKGLPGVVAGMAKDAGVAAIALGDKIMGGGSDNTVSEGANPQTVAQAFDKAEEGNTKDWLGWLISMAPSGGDIGGSRGPSVEDKRRAAIEKLKASIDNGEVPVGDEKALRSWMDSHHADLPGLSDAQNAPLLSSYMITRSPLALAQLTSNLLLNDVQKSGKADVKTAIESEGAQQLPESMREHLATAGDPVNQLMLVAPFLRGAKAVQAAGAASKLAQLGASMGEQAAFGAAVHLRDNPDAGAADTAEAAAQMAVVGGAMTGAHLAIGESVKAFTPKKGDPVKVVADGQLYVRTAEGEWNAVSDADQSGNMLTPVRPDSDLAHELEKRAEPQSAPPAPKQDEPPPVENAPETPPPTNTDENAPASQEGQGQERQEWLLKRPVPPAQAEPPPSSESGAAAPSESPPASEQTASPDANSPPQNGTSIKNAVTDAERAARGEAPIVKEAERSWGAAWTSAVDTAAKDPQAGTRLVEDLNSTPRSLTDDEDALLLHEKLQRRRRVRELVDQINAAPEELKPGLQSQLSVALEDLNKVDNAAKRAGTATGRGLNARKMMRDEDNNLESMLSTYRAAKGAEMTPDEVQHVQDLHREITDAAKAIDEHDDAMANARAEEAIATIQEELRLEMSDRADAARKRLEDRRAAASKPKSAGYPDGLPDRVDGVEWDMVDFVRAEGGIGRPPKLKRNRLGDLEGQGRGEHDSLRRWREDDPKAYGKFTSDSGRAIDESAQQAFEEGLIDEPSPDAFLAKLQDDIQARRTGRREARDHERQMQREESAAMREGLQLAREQNSSMRVQDEAEVPVTERAKNFFQEAREKARRRIEDQRNEFLSGNKFSTDITAPIRTTLDHTIIGASYLAEGLITFAEWSAAMIKEFGEGIKPHLDRLFENAKMMHDQVKTDFVEDAKAKQRARTPEGVLEGVVKGVESGKIDPVNFSPKIAIDLAKAYIQSGVKELGPLVEKVHADVVKMFPELTPREIRDAISGYGKTKKPSANEVQKQLQEMKAQARLVSAYEDAAKGEAPKKSGFQRGKPSDKVRELGTKLKDLMRRMGIATSGKDQLANARDAIVSRLKNQIADLNLELTGKKKPRDPRDPVQYDSEMIKLKKERDELQAYLDDLTGPSPEFEWNQRAEAAAKASAENYRRRIAASDLENKRGGSFEPTEKTKMAIAERDAAKADWEALRESAGIPQREALESLKARLLKRITELQDRVNGKAKPEAGKPIPLDPEALAMKAQIRRLNEVLDGMNPTSRKMTDSQRAEAATRAAEKAIADIEKELATGQRPTKPGSSFVPDAKLRALKAELESLRGIRDAARKAKIPRRSPEEIALAALKKRLASQTAKLEKRLAENDLSPRSKKEIAMDKEAIDLKAAYERKRLEFARAVEAKRLADRPTWKKITDTIVRWRRGFILSGYTTLEKLAGAATLRIAMTPIEEVVGAALGKLPAIKDVAAKAPRQGGVSLKAESKAITDGVMGAIKQMGTALKTGKSSIDMLFGKNHMEDLNPSVIDFFGHLHMALKLPAKLNEFERSFQKRAEFAMRYGLDVHDPVIQMGLMKEAYADANRAIFMQDNFAVKAFNNAIAGLENSKSNPVAGKIAASLARMLIPIVKVPTNIVFETGGSYLAGLPRGAVELVMALHKGMENLEPEKADAIMRHLKKGSIGAAMMLFGFYNHKNVGGYRQEREKRKASDVPAGDLRVGDTIISHHLLHTPAADAMQFGATMARVANDIVKSGEEKGQKRGMDDGAKAAALGLVGQVPFVNPRTFEVFSAGHQGDYARRNLVAGLAVPLGVQQLAEQLDSKEKREVKTVLDAIKEGIPGLRQTLPEAKVKKGGH